MNNFMIGDKVVANERGKRNWHKLEKQPDIIFDIVYVIKNHHSEYYEYIIYNPLFDGHKATDYTNNYLPPVEQRKDNYYYVLGNDISLYRSAYIDESDML